MTFYAPSVTGSFNLQATLATSTCSSDPPPNGPHHPISCQSTLALAEDGTLTCEHAQVPPDDPRTQACLDHSIAILLIELLRQREDTDAVPG